MFNITTVEFDRPSPSFISQTLRDGTPQGTDHTLLVLLVELPPMWEFLHSKAKDGTHYLNVTSTLDTNPANKIHMKEFTRFGRESRRTFQ
jgi:hypothetical protein